MKTLVLSALLITSVLAQENPVVKTFLLHFTTNAGNATTVNTSSAIVDFTASGIQRNGALLQLKGNAEITYADGGVQADEIDYHWDTGKIEARGHVRLTSTVPVTLTTN
jgi:lipopolysaccharide assembly outer membrane protein LptD (OstA)